MATIDYRKRLAHLYAPSASEVAMVDVPAMNFLAVDGRGDPNSTPAYATAVEALFSLSYAVKFAVKKSAGEVDNGVMPLEGLWWAADMDAFIDGDRAGWLWTMMIMQPQPVTAALVAELVPAVMKKKRLPTVADVRFESFAEGPSAQIMHVGPFSTEGPTIALLHQHIADRGHELAGKHHEIYLSDIRRADPSRWKTVIRQPFT